MAIYGFVVLEDVEVSFSNDNLESNHMTFTVTDLVTGESETLTCEQHKFFKALAIAVHNDGMPDYKADYADAESIQVNIRWIP